MNKQTQTNTNKHTHKQTHTHTHKHEQTHKHTHTNKHRYHCNIKLLILFCRIVSLVAEKTNLMFSVSTAVVKWWKSGRVLSFRRESNKQISNFWTSSRHLGSADFGNWFGKYSLKRINLQLVSVI